MEFLATATMAPMNSMGPVGMMIAFIIWIILLYVGYRLAISMNKIVSFGYIISFLIAIFMGAGLVIMLTSNLVDVKNTTPIASFVTAAYGTVAMISLGSVGGFIALMAASCGFLFGVLVRMLDSMTQGRR